MAYKQKNNPFLKNSPNKFLGGLVGKAMGGLGKAALGGIGNLLGGRKLFGGRSGQGGGGFNPSMLMGMSGQFSSNNSGSGNADATQAALNAQQSAPLTKKKSKYKKK
tara:strand:- start:168 stop:488 length:321 start_codon:yes stop_codon:yes gene_type:complete